jgi:pSer/pThr/pTyr-binding forkhead associated (FHA) protein
MIDGTRVGQAALVDGSVILIGTTSITYRTG